MCVLTVWPSSGGVAVHTFLYCKRDCSFGEDMGKQYDDLRKRDPHMYVYSSDTKLKEVCHFFRYLCTNNDDI